MPTVGYDAFFTNPGAHASMRCRVCGAECLVTRSRIGPTGFAEAVEGIERPHDRFVCPHADLPWHNAALDLLHEADEEQDPILQRALLQRLRLALARQGMI